MRLSSAAFLLWAVNAGDAVTALRTSRQMKDAELWQLEKEGDAFWAKFLQLDMSVPTSPPVPPPTPNPTIPLSTPAPMLQVWRQSPVSPVAPTLAPVSPVAPTLAPVSPVAPTLAPVSPIVPTLKPVVPTSAPLAPTSKPVLPTRAPVKLSKAPTKAPTAKPTKVPTAKPTKVPTAKPTSAPPTTKPTSPPTEEPTPSPSFAPTKAPTSFPTSAPTLECNISAGERAVLIENILKGVSDPTALSTTGTPQNLAQNWLINLDPYYVCPQDDKVVQRYTLAVFYYSTEGDDWAKCSAPTDFSDQTAIDVAIANCPGKPWLMDISECEWAGAICNDENSTERIDIEKNELGGTLPSELASLTAMKYLLLEEGLITGTIPSELGLLSLMLQIDMNFNLLRGSLPNELFNLINLTQLDLNDNELTGSFSTEIGKLTSLSFLQVENNFMTGTIPTEFGNLGLLSIATFHSNSFSGTMPAQVCSNTTGMLMALTADCLGGPSRPSPPFVECACCTQCF
ncbi:hypothetical protein MHU86_20236 [Fragilaria crotonensis]|nr:hypothetical protein MHU86_20236 [Fragilaria crotonensis]